VFPFNKLAYVCSHRYHARYCFYIYGFTIVADSPIYNTAISEVTDPELLGIALGIQSVLGFSATTFAPLIISG
jgi:hypothetical protein